MNVAAVHIDDLADPQFSPEAAAVRDAMAPMAEGVRIEPDALMAAAIGRTGLDDFGDPWFREPLAVICEAAKRDADLAPSGLISGHGMLVQLLVNRLLLEDLIRRHPEIHDIPIERPIVIAGLPRTGTTHLHNLIAADPALRSLPYWESLEPVLAEEDQPAPGEADPRVARAAQSTEFLDTMTPYFKRMHEMTAEHVHEEIHLLAMAFSTMLFETASMGPLPTYQAWYKATDQTPAYRYLRTVLQALQWLRGGTRWVLKSPQHLEQFGPLMAVFPDATVAVTHRDPVAITASLATMIAYTARTGLAKVDPHAIGAYWSARVEDLLRACAEERHLLPSDQSIDIRFHEFMADDVATVERVYALAGQPFDDRARAAMSAYLASHQRDRHGRVIYDLADLGLDRAERRAALQFYVDRFGVEIEENWA